MIKLVFRADTHLHIGSAEKGREEAMLECFKVKIKPSEPDEVPVIPSSSIKGALRALCERIAKSMVNEMSPDAANATQKHNEDEIAGLHHTKEGSEEELAASCPIDRLFGSTSFSAALRLTDLWPTNCEVKTSYVTSVGIDRSTQTRREGVLFSSEVIERGAEFVGYAILDLGSPKLKRDMPKESRELLKGLLDTLMTIGIQVGGRKSVGMGVLKLIRDKIEIYKIDSLHTLINPERISYEEFLSSLSAT